jgi:Uma2 family endonuclease
MNTLLGADRPLLTADEFCAIDQHTFGDAWRYELVDGRVVAMAPTTDKHALILSNLIVAVAAALAAAGLPCRVFSGNGVRPANALNRRVRIPDATVMCRNGKRRRPVVLFEVLSPSNEGPEYAERFDDLKQVESVEEIVELAQDSVEARIHRRHEGGWQVGEARGEEAALKLHSLGVSVPMAALYADL